MKRGKGGERGERVERRERRERGIITQKLQPGIVEVFIGGKRRRGMFSMIHSSRAFCSYSP
jgi:hypothetical protein